jgi:hypothetical protein
MADTAAERERLIALLTGTLHSAKLAFPSISAGRAKSGGLRFGHRRRAGSASWARISAPGIGSCGQGIPVRRRLRCMGDRIHLRGYMWAMGYGRWRAPHHHILSTGGAHLPLQGDRHLHRRYGKQAPAAHVPLPQRRAQSYRGGPEDPFDRRAFPARLMIRLRGSGTGIPRL